MLNQALVLDEDGLKCSIFSEIGRILLPMILWP